MFSFQCYLRQTLFQCKLTVMSQDFEEKYLKFFSFREDNDEHWKSKLFARIRRGQYDKSRMGSVSQDAKDLINSLLEVNPAVRTSASEALKHPWIVNIPAEMESPNSHSERRSSATGTSVDDPFSSQSMLSNRAPPKRRDSLQHAQSLLSSLFGSFGDHSHRAHPPSL